MILWLSPHHQTRNAHLQAFRSRFQALFVRKVSVFPESHLTTILFLVCSMIVGVFSGFFASFCLLLWFSAGGNSLSWVVSTSLTRPRKKFPSSPTISLFAVWPAVLNEHFWEKDTEMPAGARVNTLWRFCWCFFQFYTAQPGKWGGAGIFINFIVHLPGPKPRNTKRYI